MTIVNDDSRVITKLETSLTDEAEVVIYDRHMFIVQATVEVIFIFFCFFCQIGLFEWRSVTTTTIAKHPFSIIRLATLILGPMR
jgi:hypothetical protein